MHKIVNMINTLSYTHCRRLEMCFGVFALGGLMSVSEAATKGSMNPYGLRDRKLLR